MIAHGGTIDYFVEAIIQPPHPRRGLHDGRHRRDQPARPVTPPPASPPSTPKSRIAIQNRPEQTVGWFYLMSMSGGRCVRRRNGEGIPPVPSARVIAPTLGPSLQRRHRHRASPNHFLRTHRPSPCPAPGPRKNAKNAAPTPRFAGPAPTATTEFPDAVGQYPGGSRSEDDPCPVGGTCGPEVLAALPLIQHRCDIVNTLVRDPAGFFCHSVILARNKPELARIGQK